VLRSGPSVLFKQCIPMPKVGCKLMYSNAQSRVQINGQYSEEFDVQVRMHQGSVLSPLLFILVFEALSLSRVVIAGRMEECINKLKTWKSAMQSKVFM